MNKTTRILVVEDDPPSRELVTYLLEESGYTVLTANDGNAGLEKARTDHPDLIICDVQLPKLDGYGVVRQLKEDPVLGNIPIVAVTALAMVGDRSRILSAGFDGYITKPIEPATFVKEIAGFLPEKQRLKVVQNGAEETHVPPPPHSPAQPAATILVVDDTPENIEFACSTLEPSGYKVFTAPGVQEAIRLAEKSRPDLILCDLHMHPQGGRDLLEIAPDHPLLEQIPIVIISSTYTHEGERLQCLERGAAHFIKRPIEPEALLGEIAQALAQTKTP
jgi:two-component system cell cycle response regulator